MEDKNIDILFQEKLKNLEATPNKKVWNTIESKLKNKKSRILPMWWFSIGIAAFLILGFLLFPFSNDNNTDKQPVIIAFPDTNTENFNSIKKESDSLFNKNNTKTILVKQSKKDKNPQLLIAKETQKNIKKRAKDSVGKKAMKKIFLTDTKFNKTFDSINNKTIIAQENVLENTEKKISILLKKSINIVKKSDLFPKNKIEVVKPKKDILTVINDDKKQEKNNIKKYWSISPIVAVLNSNSFSNTSPIDANLSNSTSGNNSYSYGIQVGFKVNNKWTIQSGVHLQEISFSNNQIAIVSTSSSSSSIAFNSGDNFALEDASGSNLDSNTFSLNAISLDGNLDQKYGYIEIPVEIKYNLIERKKFKTEIVAGFSSLFLNKNTINLSANSFSRPGKATNLNNINFSGNFGFDFNYIFSENWSLNLNPMLKTQLNTFSKQSNGFKPYFIGIYTGINYQF